MSRFYNVHQLEIRSTLQPELLRIETGGRRPYEVEITVQELAIRGLPEKLHGAHFVHLTDFHGGYANTDPVFEEAIRQIESLQPEFVFLTGDYVDDKRAPAGYKFGDILSRIRARHGVFGTLGNHDDRAGSARVRQMLEQHGVCVLQNESVCVGPGLWVAGIDDLLEGQPLPDLALREVPSDHTPVVLAHNPTTVERVRDHPVVMLSGHTHGGQIVLPLLNPRIVCWVHLRCRQVAGWYAYGKARVYVNRGLGVTGKPFRYRCPAEIAIFRLTPEKTANTSSMGGPEEYRQSEPAYRR